MDKIAWGLVLLLLATFSVPMPARQESATRHVGAAPGSSWPELEQCMKNMHAGMESIKPSGNNDHDFVALMLPHHQAAIDMARTELMYGSDPQMRRLAQEIIADQQSETALMQLWLKQNGPSPQK